MRIAINGMGRIGRLLARRLIKVGGMELVAVNDIMSPDNLAYLLRYDSVFGTLEEPVSYGDGYLVIGEKRLIAFQTEHPSELPWAALGVDIVLECTGRFTHGHKAAIHLTAGARKVLLSTTGSPELPLLVYGYNQQVLNLHSYTSRQELVDAPHNQHRRGRAAAESIIPVEIDLAVSLERLLPDLKNRVATVSTRVPVANGAMADLSVQLKSPVSAAEINGLFKNAAIGRYKGVIDYTEDALVSLDIKGNTHSCVVDGGLTSVVGKQVKVIAWFDNEYGYTSRMIDWLFYWKKFLS
jgi:glyceraldehyde 3-phosphate dehydrogenase